MQNLLAEAVGALKIASLDPSKAQELFKSRYANYLRNIALKNRHLNRDNDADELYSDILEHVWLYVVDKFDPERVTYTDDMDRAFNSLLEMKLQQYLASQAKSRGTGKSKWEKKKKSLDAPVGRGDGKDEGDSGTLHDLIGEEPADPIAGEALQRLLNAVPDPKARRALQMIVENADRGNITQVMKEVRDETGWTKNQLDAYLDDFPEMHEFLKSVGRPDLSGRR